MKDSFGEIELGGRTKFFRKFWEKLTTDRFILDTLNGLKLDFVDGEVPQQKRLPHPIHMNNQEMTFIDKKIVQMLENKTIRKMYKYDNRPGWVSNIFLRPKKDRGYRMILNLKPLNKKLQYIHFKMDTMNDVIRMISPQMVMASIDLTEAYFHLPIFEDHIPFMRFEWKGVMYEYCALPNGLCSGPRIFTKMTKAIMKHLRKKLIRILIYIDDTFLCATSKKELRKNIQITLDVFRECGFTININKSNITPTKELEFLGFILNTASYTISLGRPKRQKIYNLCRKVTIQKKIKMRTLAKLIGNFVSTFPASEQAQLHYRHLERYKIIMLHKFNQNWEMRIRLPLICMKEIRWWLHNIFSDKFERNLNNSKPSVTLNTDSSGFSWGSDLNDGSKQAQGLFTPAQKKHSINTKELMAIFYAIKSFRHELTAKHVQVLTDNTTALSCILKKGSQHEFRDILTRKIFHIVHKNDMQISVGFVPGKANKNADRSSRLFNRMTEWSLSQKSMQLIHKYYDFNIDLFASYLNKKHTHFVSWKHDPDASYVNAFFIDWSQFQPFIFSPFSVIHRVLRKILQDDVAKAICIFPYFPTAVWFPQMMKTCIENPLLLPRWVTKQLKLPWDPDSRHPLASKMRLLLVVLSAHYSDKEVCQKIIQIK